jgi:hypothetical protein
MSELPGPVARVLEAANRHDTDAFFASFTGDGVVDDRRTVHDSSAEFSGRL